MKSCPYRRPPLSQTRACTHIAITQNDCVNSIRGRIRFLGTDEGGRKLPPTELAGQYMPHLRVNEEYLGVRILADTAVPGLHFQILEGPRVVGTGEVLH